MIFRTNPISLIFTICSISVPFIVRYWIKNKHSISILDLGYIYLSLVLIISLEGAIIYYFLYTDFNFDEKIFLKYLTFVISRDFLPVLFSAFLSRLVVNVLDKMIAVIGGFAFFLLINKIYNGFCKKTKRLS